MKLDGWTDRTDRQTTRLLELPWAAKKVEKKKLWLAVLVTRLM